jgi:hypothetical protein
VYYQYSTFCNLLSDFGVSGERLQNSQSTTDIVEPCESSVRVRGGRYMRIPDLFPAPPAPVYAIPAQLIKLPAPVSRVTDRLKLDVRLRCENIPIVSCVRFLTNHSKTTPVSKTTPDTPYFLPF